MTHVNAVVAQWFLEIPPVGIAGIQNGRGMLTGFGDCGELPVGSVEFAQPWIVGKLIEVVGGTLAGCQFYEFTAAGICPVVPQPFHECVTRARLTGGRQVTSVLREYTIRVVDCDYPLARVLQRIDACQDISFGRPGVPPIRHNRNIRINYDGSGPLHGDRSMMARSVAAISPNSSPKKSLGQFEISPNMLMSSGSREERPLSMEQK